MGLTVIVEAGHPGSGRGKAMTYGFRPENWPAFQSELEKRGIAVGDIERVEIRPEAAPAEIPSGIVAVVVTLRSGRVESWSHRQAEGMRPLV